MMNKFKSTDIKDLAIALAKCQAEIVGAVKDSVNPHFRSNYADLASVWDAIRVPMTKNGLSVTQFMHDFQLVTLLMHDSGQWIRSDYPIHKLSELNHQQMGSALTYARRYSLAAMLGVPQIDDDAETTMSRKPPPPPAQKAKVEAPKAAKVEPQGAQAPIGKATMMQKALNELKIDGRIKDKYRDAMLKACTGLDDYDLIKQALSVFVGAE